MKDWPQTVTELTAYLRNLRGGAPEVMKEFSSIANADREYNDALKKVPEQKKTNNDPRAGVRSSESTKK